MKSIPAFSKKSTGGGVATGAKARSGFTQHASVGSPTKGKAVPHMAASYPVKSTLKKTSGKNPVNHPSFKSHSGTAAKSVPAFSKKKV